ncbi:hypothetical protein J8273_5718 [Carpediemonas membranifera]|uniref:Uncharacterized protein n=1 Tax=Carpediemonas membranifera TaxID=201153 RepID=A0A8J6E1D1_9EUKA|nr:hypothetical protein J8273_5718 [Carpediemonas membranifera]|eukprot:KAG9392906.1 hypothetical protein J8273_5718 [Carpediemonas membranifera]
MINSASFVERQQLWYDLVTKKKELAREKLAKEQEEEEMRSLRPKPEISKMAQQMERATTNVVEFQREWAEQQKRKLEAKRTQIEAEEMENVTFSPAINPRSERLARRRSRPTHTNIETTLFEEALAEQRTPKVESTPTARTSQPSPPAARGEAVHERLYRMHETIQQSHEHARQQREVESAGGGTPSTNTGFLRIRTMPIEDDLLLRDMEARSIRDQRARAAEEMARRAHQPAINQNSERMAMEKRALDLELLKMYGPNAEFESIRERYVPEQPSFTPKINRSSRDMEKARFTSTEEHIEWLHMSRELAGPQEHVPTASELEDLAESTFKPKITTPPVELPEGDVVDRLYGWKQIRDARIAAIAAAKAEAEADPGYSFTPTVNRDPPPRPLSEGVAVGGLDRFLQRQAKARELRAEREQALAPRTPVGRGKVTKPREFSFSNKPGKIAALDQPVSRRWTRGRRGKAGRGSAGPSATNTPSVTATSSAVSSEAPTEQGSPQPTVPRLDVASPSSEGPLSPEVITDYSLILSMVAPSTTSATPDYQTRRVDRDAVVSGLRRRKEGDKPWRE